MKLGDVEIIYKLTQDLESSIELLQKVKTTRNFVIMENGGLGSSSFKFTVDKTGEIEPVRKELINFIMARISGINNQLENLGVEIE